MLVKCWRSIRKWSYVAVTWRFMCKCNSSNIPVLKVEELTQNWYMQSSTGQWSMSDVPFFSSIASRVWAAYRKLTAASLRIYTCRWNNSRIPSTTFRWCLDLPSSAFTEHCAEISLEYLMGFVIAQVLPLSLTSLDNEAFWQQKTGCFLLIILYKTLKMWTKSKLWNLTKLPRRWWFLRSRLTTISTYLKASLWYLTFRQMSPFLFHT